MKDYKFAIFIGRFQPLHNGHIEVIKHGLSIADKVIVIVGSTNSAPTIKNPFSFEDRKKMIMESIDPAESVTIEGAHGRSTTTKYTDAHNRVIVLGIRDYHYNYNSWMADIQGKTDQYIQEGDSVALLGDYKDSSSYYLRSFPQWDFLPIQNVSKMDATEVRERLFSVSPQLSGVDGSIKNPPDLTDLSSKLPEPVLKYLTDYVKELPYRDLVLEYDKLKSYKKSWENAPFPPTFVTADSVVICSGHVLLVKRKFSPGKGLYALPGGFIKPNEVVKDAALRELKEETGIRVDKLILESSIQQSRVFDFPGRSLRGRTITHGFYIRLKDGKLPEVRGNDDAESAFWMPLAEVFQNEHRFFEDHAHIIGCFVNRD